MTKHSKPIAILLIILIPILLFLLSFKLVIFNENFYKREFLKYDVYDKLSEYNIEKINKDVLDYFKNNDKLLKNDFFDEKEKSHLLDVKNLIYTSNFIFYFLLILIIILFFLLFIKNKKNIKKYTWNIFYLGGALTFAEVFILWLLSLINFNFLFTLFHKIFFPMGNWMFNTNIIILYPQGFFYDALVRIVFYTLAMGLILILISLLIRNKKIYKLTKEIKS